MDVQIRRFWTVRVDFESVKHLKFNKKYKIANFKLLVISSNCYAVPYNYIFVFHRKDNQQLSTHFI